MEVAEVNMLDFSGYHHPKNSTRLPSSSQPPQRGSQGYQVVHIHHASTGQEPLRSLQQPLDLPALLLQTQLMMKIGFLVKNIHQSTRREDAGEHPRLGGPAEWVTFLRKGKYIHTTKNTSTKTIAGSRVFLLGSIVSAKGKRYE